MKTLLLKQSLGLGRSVFIERTAYGAIACKADLHPDDPIFLFKIGTAKECYRALSSITRAQKNNFLGRITLGK